MNEPSFPKSKPEQFAHLSVQDIGEERTAIFEKGLRATDPLPDEENQRAGALWAELARRALQGDVEAAELMTRQRGGALTQKDLQEIVEGKFEDGLH